MITDDGTILEKGNVNANTSTVTADSLRKSKQEKNYARRQRRRRRRNYHPLCHHHANW